MKNYKIISLTLCLILTIPSIAQDTNSQTKYKKSNSEYTPIAGEYSFGISTDPFVNFIGNMFKGATAHEKIQIGGDVLLTPNIRPTVSIMGKYMLKDNLAVRVNVGVIMNRLNNAAYVVNDNIIANDPLSESKVEDHLEKLTTGGTIALGLEYRIGQGRLQGVFSGSASYSFSTVKNKYSYGNAITSENQTPTIDPTFSNGYTPTTAIPNARTLKDFSTRSANSIGLIGSVGVEWFVAPKISLGIEVNLSAIHMWHPESYKELEGYNTFSQQVETYTDLVSPGANEFYLGTGNVGSNLTINFFF